jgi:hypothetical protein
VNRSATGKYIKGHENCKLIAYDDAVKTVEGGGVRTIAWGFNLLKDDARERIEALGYDYDDVYAGKVPITQEDADLLFEQDLDDAIADGPLVVENFAFHPDDVQTALTDMRYQMGALGLSKFKKMIAALTADPPDYCAAAREMKDSLWAKQTPNRANDDIAIVQAHC